MNKDDAAITLLDNAKAAQTLPDNEEATRKLPDNEEAVTSLLDNLYLRLALRYGYLILGMGVLSYGISLMIAANLGLSAWGVFHMGLTNFLPISFGRSTQIVGLTVILISMLLKIRPTLATVLNMLLVGFFIDAINAANLAPTASTLGGSLLVLMSAVLVLGFGTGMYISADLGAGPRDSLMVGLVQRFQRPVSQMRTAIEVTVLAIGFLMGGPVAVGTVVSALLIGQVVHYSLKIFGALSRRPGWDRLISVERTEVKERVKVIDHSKGTGTAKSG